MSIRGLGDAFAFQRLLWLFIGTVIVPTVFLALYGAFAIRNHRAFLVQQVVVERETQLQGLSTDIAEELHRVDAAVRVAVVACAERPSEPCHVDEAGARRIWTWPVSEDPPAAIAGAGIPSERTDKTVWVTPPDQLAPLGVLRSKDLAVAWQLDTEALADTVERLGRERHPDQGTFGLEPVGATPALPFEEAIAVWQRPASTVTRTLDRPLTSWRLTVTAPPADARAAAMRRTNTLSLLGLIALVGTVLAGTFLTLRSTMRELQLSRLQTDFVSNVSHELRTPLTSIRMFVETLQSGRLQDPERVQECLDLLAQESDRLSRRIERVLNWAKMEAGKRTYEVEPVSPREIVDETLLVHAAQTLLGTEAEKIHVFVPDDLPTVDVDRDAIVEALLNLVNNAVRYTEPPRRIFINVEQQGNRVGFSVEDNGPGIAVGDRRRIFEKFYRADARLSTTTEGSGLGLAIVRAVVQGHNGKMELWSEVGKGSRFTMWLPAS